MKAPLRSLGILGCGHLSQCLLKGVYRHTSTPSTTLKSHSVSHISPILACVLSDKSRQKLVALAKQMPIPLKVVSNQEVVEQSDWLMVGLRPLESFKALENLAETIKSHPPKLMVSLMAGISISQLQGFFPASPIVRVMANTPSEIALGTLACFTQPQSVDTQEIIETKAFIQWLKHCGEVVWLEKEEEINIATVLSGASPAYAFYVLEAFVAWAKAQGMDEKTAQKLASQTFKGASQLAQISDKGLQQLVDEVAIKGGVTEQGILSLKEDKVDKSLQKALTQAYSKACAIDSKK